jgi:Zn-finger nucleic acid-binding protein
MSVRAYIKIKACPKCGGDIMVDRVLEDSDVCIQCGFRNYPKPAPYIPERKRRRRKTAKAESSTSQEATA